MAMSDYLFLEGVTCDYHVNDKTDLVVKIESSHNDTVLFYFIKHEKKGTFKCLLQFDKKMEYDIRLDNKHMFLFNKE